jgi:hypothetical protein
MKEPPRQKDITLLKPIMQQKVKQILSHLTSLGYDPIVFESLRTQVRQNYLYSIGRTILKNRKPVTWTFKSKHREGMAVDIISKKHGWSDPKFFIALAYVSKQYGCHTIPQEQCHVQLGD